MPKRGIRYSVLDDRYLLLDCSNDPLTGDLSTTGKIHINADSTNLEIGADSDIQIYHSGTHGYVFNNTGSLFFLNSNGNSALWLTPTAVTINDGGKNNVDFRVETNNQAYALFIDSGNDTADFNVEIDMNDKRIHNVQRVEANDYLILGDTYDNVNTYWGAVNPFTSISYDGSTPASLYKVIASSSGAQWILGKARGSSASTMAAAQDDDPLGGFIFKAHDGSNFQNSGAIRAYADGTISTGDTPGRLIFDTVPAGSTTLTSRFGIYEDGKFMIGEYTGDPIDTLGVVYGTAAGAMPTLRLQNANGAINDTVELVFKCNAGVTSNRAKGAIIFKREDTDGRGDMHFCLENTASSAAVDSTDSVMVIKQNGDIYTQNDNQNFYFGAGQDAHLVFDGTNLKIITDDVVASDLIVDCGTEKTLELAEVVWNDINIGAVNLSLPASSQPDEVQYVDENGTNTGIYTYGFDVGEKVSAEIELMHDYKEGTDLYFHVHFQGAIAPTGTDKVRWQLTYTVAQMDQTLDAVTTITKEIDYDTQYKFLICEFDAIDGTNFKIGDQFMLTLERIAATSDEYAGDAIVASIGIHYQINTLGSRQRLIK